MWYNFYILEILNNLHLYIEHYIDRFTNLIMLFQI